MMRIKGVALVFAGALLSVPLAAQESGTASAAPVAETDPTRLELSNQIIDLAYPLETRVEMFQKMSKQMEAQMLQSLQGIIDDEGAVAILTEWQDELSVKTDAIMVRNIPSLMEAWSIAYADVYTEQELRAILAFVSTPTGKTFLAKANDVLGHPAFGAANQSYMDEIMALIPAEMPGLMQRLKDYKAVETEDAGSESSATASEGGPGN
ncbi:MAG: DUF2059 domain-containing protein [Erythrobacter sp.]